MKNWLINLLYGKSSDLAVDGLTTDQQRLITNTAGSSAVQIANVMSKSKGKGVPLLSATLDDRMSSELFNILVQSASALPPSYQQSATVITTHMHQLRGMSQRDSTVIGQILSLPPESIAENTKESVSMITRAIVNRQIQEIGMGRGR